MATLPATLPFTLGPGGPVVEPEEFAFTVPFEDRSFTVAFEDRSFVVGDEF